MTNATIPIPDAETGLLALKAMIDQRSPLAALQVFHARLGDVFQINLPGFKPVVLVGPKAARFVLVKARDELLWRNESDPVTELLRHGVLVEDGEVHDELRRNLNPALHRRMLENYTMDMSSCVERVTSSWQSGDVVDMLVEMRKIALSILTQTLFRVDIYPELGSLWKPILDSIHYISPGLWMVWSGAPNFRYRNTIRKMDIYLYRIISERRAIEKRSMNPPQDMLGHLIETGMHDDLIRDQLFTILIAGHDTVTANMAWTLYLLGCHARILHNLQEEIHAFDNPFWLESSRTTFLDQVIKESLRLYPPIHLGSRLAAMDLEFDGYPIPQNTRVIYSIYLTQRHPDYWTDPNLFIPDRYTVNTHPQPYTWLAFGGGARNCIGLAFGQLEAKVVIAEILSRFQIELVEPRVFPHMGATLEPRPGVRMRIFRRD
jgi:cytochrome P450